MDRRTFLTSAAGALTASAALPIKNAWADHGHGHGGELGALILDKHKALLNEVRKTAFDCVSVGAACVQHCNEQLIAGNQDAFKECAITVSQMMPLCNAVGTLAAGKAAIIGKVLEACIEACKNCKEACAKHSKHFGAHPECKACMGSCDACIKACVLLNEKLNPKNK